MPMSTKHEVEVEEILKQLRKLKEEEKTLLKKLIELCRKYRLSVDLEEFD